MQRRQGAKIRSNSYLCALASLREAYFFLGSLEVNPKIPAEAARAANGRPRKDALKGDQVELVRQVLDVELTDQRDVLAEEKFFADGKVQHRMGLNKTS